MIAVIGGTGLYSFLIGTQVAPVTPYGSPSSPITQGLLEGQSALFLARHGRHHSIPPHKVNYRANLWALRALGARQVISVNAVGGISEQMLTGVLVTPHQLVDYSYGREHTYFDGSATGGEFASVEHIDFSQPFSSTLREVIQHAGRKAQIELISEAVYGVTQGPRLETAAEIDRMEKEGCDIVGMTAMPEAALARELKMEYASLSLVVNPAAGRSSTEITMADIRRVLDEGIDRVKSVLAHCICQ